MEIKSYAERENQFYQQVDNEVVNKVTNKEFTTKKEQNKLTIQQKIEFDWNPAPTILD
nr:MAG: hypothetical protein [Microvirus sp.]